MPSESITRTLQLFGRTVLRWSTEVEGSDMIHLDVPDGPEFGFSIPSWEGGDDDEE